MKITTTREQILPALTQVTGLVERRQTMAILGNLRFIGRCDGQIELTGTDSEIQLETRFLAEYSGAFETTLPARKLFEIVRSFPDGAVIGLDIKGDRAVLSSGRGRYSLNTLPAVDFPALEFADGVDVVSLTEGVLHHLLEKARLAMAQQDVRYYLNGMLLELIGDRIRCVATDGHRLALCEAVLESPVEPARQVILPHKAVQELTRLLQGSSAAPVGIVLGSGHAGLMWSGVRFSTRLIDGRYPDYHRVIPRPAEHPVIVDRDEFRAAMARAGILANEKYRGVRFELRQGALALQAHNPEQDEAEEEIMAQYEGPAISIGFNVAYVLDVLNVLSPGEISLSIADSNASCLITSYGTAGARFVVMPMRL